MNADEPNRLLGVEVLDRPPNVYDLRVGVLGPLEVSGAGNVILRVGHTEYGMQHWEASGDRIALSPGEVRELIRRLSATLGEDAVCEFACAECGTQTARTYVVTTLDYVDVRHTRTEVCRTCDETRGDAETEVRIVIGRNNNAILPCDSVEAARTEAETLVGIVHRIESRTVTTRATPWTTVEG